MIARQLRIEGRVQGVGYREAMGIAARVHGVQGWVRNRRDGAVEALVQGGDDAVARVIAWARSGPPAARVDRFDVAEAAFDATLRGFSRLPTA